MTLVNDVFGSLPKFGNWCHKYKNRDKMCNFNYYLYICECWA
jgi:hypothetical protein